MDIKESTINVNNKTFKRLLIKTHVISKDDKILEVIERYAKPVAQKGDILIISERIIAIMQGRSFFIKDIKPSFLAQHLYKMVAKNPGGIGLRSPYTMELAIREAGAWRILLGAIVAVLTKPFGVKGMFYRFVGHGINAIDGPCDYTLYPGNVSAKLGPKNPSKVAQEISDYLGGLDVVIIDANDLGRRVEGTSKNADAKFAEEVFRDNPFGQRDEQTPMGIVRVIN